MPPGAWPPLERLPYLCSPESYSPGLKGIPAHGGPWLIDEFGPAAGFGCGAHGPPTLLSSSRCVHAPVHLQSMPHTLPTATTCETLEAFGEASKQELCSGARQQHGGSPSAPPGRSRGKRWHSRVHSAVRYFEHDWSEGHSAAGAQAQKAVCLHIALGLSNCMFIHST